MMYKFSNYAQALCIALLLAACGGNPVDTASTAKTASPVNPANSYSPTSLLAGLAATYPNGKLPPEQAAAAAAQLAQNPAALSFDASTAKTTNQVSAQASTASYSAVQRAQNTSLFGSYFFSIYPSEMTNALATNPKWNLEGTAFFASLVASDELSPVWRFRNILNGSYLYTINEAEKNDIIANYSAYFILEGPAWYASAVPGTGLSALYRFRNLTNGTYLFTSYESEKNDIVAQFSATFKLEGTSYYVNQTMPVAPPVVPPIVIPAVNLDTGITANQCYAAGSNALVACRSPGAIALSNTQDGMGGWDKLEPSNTDGKLGFSYETVTGGCIKDNRTGLVWEHKTADGNLRDWNKTYTNFDDTTKPQRYNGSAFVNPTAAEVAAATNTVGYAAAVNATSLCGFTDWRLPTVDELQGLVDYSLVSPSPMIDSTWFVNTQTSFYWSSTSYAALVGAAFYVNFGIGDALVKGRIGDHGVRLVRGAPATPAVRYAYSADGSEVIDAKTGLTWQRCAAPMAWINGLCTGTASVYSHEQALTYAKTQASSTSKEWRLPNVKELASIADKTKSSPAINTTVFPAMQTTTSFASSSPNASYPQNAWGVFFDTGYVYYYDRITPNNSVRLVRER